MQNTRLKYLTLAAGIVTVLAIVFSQTFYFETQASAEKATAEKTAPATENQIVVAPSVSLPIPSSIQINHEFTFITEFSFDEWKEEVVAVASPLLHKFFSTLLQVIISPNAP
jgi:Flp pilus assembly protein CpaB